MAKATPQAAPPPVPETPADIPWAPPVRRAATPGLQYQPGDPPHRLVWYPGCYYLCDGAVVPLLSELSAVPGRDGVGVETDPDTRQRYATYDEQDIVAQRRGAVVIPHDIDAAAGHPSYLKEVPGTGTVCHRLCTLVPGAPPQPPASHVYRAWLESLYDRTAIQRPRDHDIQRVMGTHSRIEEISDRNSRRTSNDLAALRESFVPASA